MACINLFTKLLKQSHVLSQFFFRQYVQDEPTWSGSVVGLLLASFCHCLSYFMFLWKVQKTWESRLYMYHPFVISGYPPNESPQVLRPYFLGLLITSIPLSIRPYFPMWDGFCFWGVDVASWIPMMAGRWFIETRTLWSLDCLEICSLCRRSCLNKKTCSCGRMGRNYWVRSH